MPVLPNTTQPGYILFSKGTGQNDSYWGPPGQFTNVAVINQTLVSNATTVAVTSFALLTANLTNNSSAAATITLATSGAQDGQHLVVRFYDFAATVENLTWVGTENTLQSVPATSKGSTTIPAFVGLIFNGVTSKWSCVAVA